MSTGKANIMSIETVSAWALMLLMPFLALLLEGLKRKVVARMQDRVGPPLIQPVYDVLKLFYKEHLSEGNFVFEVVPYLAFINALLLFLFVPFALFSFEVDFLVFGYLFLLLDTWFILGALASGSPFAFHAIVRDLILMLGYEVGLLLTLSLFMLKANVLSFAAFNAEFLFLQMPLASFGLLAAGLIVLKVTPFDVVAAEPELSAGMLTEYTGRKLALMELAEYFKKGAFYLLAGMLLFGKNYAIPAAFFFVLLYALIQAVSPRYSVFKSGKIFLVGAIILFADLFFLV
jgi:formate hydrogenlyase subunit 4